jgi:hypothetical protein
MHRKNKRENIRTFYEWWNNIPEELKKESSSDNNNKNSENLVNSINYILLKTEISKMNNIKPIIEELKYWIYSRQI